MSLPTGSLMLTVAVNDVDATKIVYAAEFGKHLAEQGTAQRHGQRPPGIMTKPEVYK